MSTALADALQRLADLHERVISNDRRPSAEEIGDALSQIIALVQLGHEDGRVTITVVEPDGQVHTELEPEPVPVFLDPEAVVEHAPRPFGGDDLEQVAEVVAGPEHDDRP